MLSTTRNLIALYEREEAGWQEVEFHAAIVLRHGSRADAEALLPVFLSAPERRGALISQAHPRPVLIPAGVVHWGHMRRQRRSPSTWCANGHLWLHRRVRIP